MNSQSHQSGIETCFYGEHLWDPTNSQSHQSGIETGFITDLLNLIKTLNRTNLELKQLEELILSKRLILSIAPIWN
tara:strand:+ start:62 stop:289 length:228 start_codon:yes stop_codon:yes gene_type:complete